MGAKHIGIMGDEVKGQGQEHTPMCTLRGYLCWRTKRSSLRGAAVHGSSGMMEGVHEEFKLTLRENKLERRQNE